MDDVTVLLQKLQSGDSSAGERLARLVYQELRSMAARKVSRDRAGATLSPTSLVHEAWVRLGDAKFGNRAHFFSAAAEAMRRILVERARRKDAEKRGGLGVEHVDIADVEIAAPTGSNDEVLAVHEALDELARFDPRQADVVKLRYFVGLTFEEVAELMSLSVRTVKAEWAHARAWLHARIKVSD